MSVSNPQSSTPPLHAEVRAADRKLQNEIIGIQLARHPGMNRRDAEIDAMRIMSLITVQRQAVADALLAALPEKKTEPVYLEHESIFLFPGYVDTTHPLHNSADIRMVQEHDMKCLRCGKIFSSRYEATNTGCDRIEGAVRPSTNPLAQSYNLALDAVTRVIGELGGGKDA